MGVKAVPVEVFLAYLESLGLIAFPGKGSHTKYNFPKDYPGGQLPRPVIVRLEYKDIPVDHISTNLRTLGKTKADFEAWLDEYRGKRKAGGKEE